MNRQWHKPGRFIVLLILVVAWGPLSLSAAADPVLATAVTSAAGVTTLVFKYRAALPPHVIEERHEVTVSFQGHTDVVWQGAHHLPAFISIVEGPRHLNIGSKQGVISVNRLAGTLSVKISAPEAGVEQHEQGSGAAHAAEPSATDNAVLPGLPASMVAVVDGLPKAVSGSELNPGSSSSNRQSTVLAAPEQEQGASKPIVRPDDDSPISVVASVTRSRLNQQIGLMLPCEPHVGAAAIREHDELIVVLDSNNPVDLSGLASDPVFGKATFSVLPSGAVLRLRVRKEQQAEVRREAAGWFITLVDQVQQPVDSIVPVVQAGTIELRASKPSHVLTVVDPERGAELVVGTVRQDHQGVVIPRSTVSWLLRSTILGVAIERLSDSVELRPVADGFTLDATSSGVEADPEKLRSGLAFSRAVDLPAVNVAEWQRRFKAALLSSASSPPADRRAPRLDAAQAALALGEGREAGVIAAVAESDAPGGAGAERACFLRAAAAVLEGAADARSRLSDTCVGNSDEVDLWRAIEAGREKPDDPDAASAIARRLPLLESYPAQLKRQLTGVAASTLVHGGTAAQAALISELGDGADVDLAKASLAARQGKMRDALSGFKKLQGDPDPAVEVAATEEVVALQMKEHTLSPGQAADLLEAQTLNARMAGRELALRLEVAGLRSKARNWTTALSDLRDSLLSFPGSHEQVEKAAGDVMQAAIATDSQGVASLPSTALGRVALVESSLDLLPAGDQKVRVALALSARLADLDLPDEAAALLQKAMKEHLSDRDRGVLGLTLARLEIDRHNLSEAVGALDATEMVALAPDMVQARALLRAQAFAAQGMTDASLDAVRGLTGIEADELRAKEFAVKHDWTGEASSLTNLVTARCPVTGQLAKDDEDLVLRLVEATAQAEDQQALRKLDATWAPRFHDTDRVAMLRLFTSGSISSEVDRPNTASEPAAGRATPLGVGQTAKGS